jgi:hypothetical protein
MGRENESLSGIPEKPMSVAVPDFAGKYRRLDW